MLNEPITNFHFLKLKNVKIRKLEISLMSFIVNDFFFIERQTFEWLLLAKFKYDALKITEQHLVAKKSHENWRVDNSAVLIERGC